MGQKEPNTLTVTAVIRETIRCEEALRQKILFRGREAAMVDGSGFEFTGLRVKTALPGPGQGTDLGPGAVLLQLYGTYRTKNKGDWQEEEICLNDQQLLCRLPASSEEQWAILQEAQKTVNEMADLMVQNYWKLWPTFRELIDDATLWHMIYWYHEDKEMFIWARAWLEALSLIGSRKGHVRLCRLPEEAMKGISLTDARECKGAEVSALLRYGEMGRPQEFLRLCEEEREYLAMRQKIRQTYGNG